MTATMATPTGAQPPGQQQLLPPRPTSSSTSYRIVTAPPSPADTPRWSEAIRDLPLAASKAARAAETHGEAWLVSAEGSAVLVTAAGDVVDVTGAPLSGWAVLASRVITNRRDPLTP